MSIGGCYEKEQPFHRWRRYVTTGGAPKGTLGLLFFPN